MARTRRKNRKRPPPLPVSTAGGGAGASGGGMISIVANTFNTGGTGSDTITVGGGGTASNYFVPEPGERIINNDGRYEWVGKPMQVPISFFAHMKLEFG